MANKDYNSLLLSLFNLDNHTAMNPMLNIGVRAARAAGRVITKNMGRQDAIRVEKKGHNDFATEVDKEAEAEIAQTLLKAYPDHGVLAEENGQLGNPDSDFQWIVDPLDGTMNFMHGFPHFSVSIALYQAGRPFQAIIYDPVRQELFTGGKGDGAYLDGRRIRVSGAAQLEHALIGTGFPVREGKDLGFEMATYEAFTRSCSGTRCSGSAALDLAYIAAGRLDGAWLSGLQSWDFAAGALLVREAGGLVNDYHGGDTWADSGNLIAGSPKVHHGMLQTMGALLRERN